MKALPWVVLAVVLALSLANGFRDGRSIERLEARDDSLAQEAESLATELVSARVRERASAARADAAEERHAQVRETVRIVSETSLVIAGVSDALIVPAPVVTRIQAADRAAERWKALAGERLAVIGILEATVANRDSALAVKDSIIAILKPSLLERVNITAGLTLGGDLALVVGVQLADLGDLVRLLPRWLR